MKKLLLRVSVLSFMLIGLLSCGSDPKNAKVEVWLTDSPGDYQEVNIDIQGVEVHVGDGASESGWKTLAVDGGVYNLLDLTNGLDTLLGYIELPAGRISQVRLKLGNENSIKVDGETFNLSTPSAQQSGLKILVNQTLVEGITYKVLLDFDVARSIVVTGSEKYILKPVIRAFAEVQDGAIKGVVSPKESTPAIFAISGIDTLGTTFCDTTTGAFLLRGLDAGSYKVVFLPNSAYGTTTIENVNVTLGAVTNMGTIEIGQ